MDTEKEIPQRRKLQNQRLKQKLKTRLKQSLLLTSSILLFSCGVPPDDWDSVTLEQQQNEFMASADASLERWIVASQFLPREKLQGLQHAGFFEIGDSIYSHHCDPHGNMIRMKYNEENKTWKQIRYETLGCGHDD